MFESLSGKFNYPYLKGIRYGELGECIIEGLYSEYSVNFDENSTATLYCNIAERDKKSRYVMLEAIAVRHYINKFFNPNLPFDAVKQYNSLKIAEAHRKFISVVVTVATLLVAAGFLMNHLFPETFQRAIIQVIEPGSEVRNSYLTQYSSSRTIEDAFDDYFGEGEWSTYDKEGSSYVTFSGTCTIDNERADIKITFKIMVEHFVVDSLEINGRLNNLMITSILDAVYKK
jgi:hypothetical protein